MEFIGPQRENWFLKMTTEDTLHIVLKKINSNNQIAAKDTCLTFY